MPRKIASAPATSCTLVNARKMAFSSSDSSSPITYLENSIGASRPSNAKTSGIRPPMPATAPAPMPSITCAPSAIRSRMDRGSATACRARVPANSLASAGSVGRAGLGCGRAMIPARRPTGGGVGTVIGRRRGFGCGVATINNTRVFCRGACLLALHPVD